MRRSLVLVMVIGMISTVFAVDASAGAGRPRVYEGALGDGGATIQLELVKRPDRPLAMREFDFGVVDMTCSVDGAVQQWGVAFGWGGQLPSLPSHTLDMDEVDQGVALHLHGKIQAVRGEGTLSFATAQFTADEQLQTCGTGELPWSVERTVPPVLNPPPTGTPIEVRHLVMPDGTRITLTRYA